MNRVLLFLAAFATTTSLNAQTTPIVAQFPVGDAAWVVDVNHAKVSPNPQTIGTADSGSVFRVRVEVVRKGNVSRYKTTWSNHKATEDWTTDKLIFLQHPEGLYYSLITDPSIVMFERWDQSDFAWTKEAMLIGEETYHGRKCLHVKGKMARAWRDSQSSVEAWIDSETHLPLALLEDQMFYLYTFRSPPAESLKLPPQCQTLLARHEKAVATPERLGE